MNDARPVQPDAETPGSETGLTGRIAEGFTLHAAGVRSGSAVRDGDVDAGDVRGRLKDPSSWPSWMSEWLADDGDPASLRSDCDCQGRCVGDCG